MAFLLTEQRGYDIIVTKLNRNLHLLMEVKIMYFLENVFKSYNFDLNDAVLVDYDIYFDKDSGKYNSFSLDDGDLPKLHRLIMTMKSYDSACKIYVLTYGYELTYTNGEKYTYADQLWIDTNLTICKIKDLISTIGLEEPSEIRFLKDCDEIKYYQIYLISRTQNGEAVISEMEKEKADQIVTLFWD